MKVFISSTCYDLLDLRAELLADLRDLGVEVLLSDHKDSDFVVPSDPAVNSIEACLVNVRDSDVMIMILSQRYGSNLGPPFGKVSATHAEYIEARKLEKPIYFYVRDRLDGDFGAWRRNDSKADYVGPWCGKDGTKGLFRLIEAHRKLVGDDGTASSNNWYSTFTDSRDLRADVRRRLAPQAFRATGEKLVQTGQAPIILVQGQGISCFDSTPSRSNIMWGVYWRFTFTLLNAGPVPAIGVSCILELGDAEYGVASGGLAAVLPGDDFNTRQARTVQFDVPTATMQEVFAAHAVDGVFGGVLRIGYRTPTGHEMLDRSVLTVKKRGDHFEFASMVGYHSKMITGMRNFF